jgi:hypothetical protein
MIIGPASRFKAWQQIGRAASDAFKCSDQAGALSGAANTDGDIVTEVGADTLYADGSLYISVLDGTGNLWQKQNDVWVDIT